MRKEKENKGHPPYDDDRFYETESVTSATDCTGLQPTPPKSEGETESYSDLYNIPQPEGKVDNGLRRLRPGDEKKK